MNAAMINDEYLNSEKYFAISNRKNDEIEEGKGFYFSDYEWYVFKEELKLGKSIDTALHNARYYGELKKRIDDIEAGRNLVTFTEEEWEKMISEQNI